MSSLGSEESVPIFAESVLAILGSRGQSCSHYPKVKSSLETGIPSCLGFWAQQNDSLLVLKTSVFCIACYSFCVPRGYMSVISDDSGFPRSTTRSSVVLKAPGFDHSNKSSLELLNLLSTQIDFTLVLKTRLSTLPVYCDAFHIFSRATPLLRQRKELDLNIVSAGIDRPLVSTVPDRARGTRHISASTPVPGKTSGLSTRSVAPAELDAGAVPRPLQPRPVARVSSLNNTTQAVETDGALLVRQKLNQPNAPRMVRSMGNQLEKGADYQPKASVHNSLASSVAGTGARHKGNYRPPTVEEDTYEEVLRKSSGPANLANPDVRAEPVPPTPALTIRPLNRPITRANHKPDDLVGPAYRSGYPLDSENRARLNLEASVRAVEDNLGQSKRVPSIENSNGSKQKVLQKASSTLMDQPVPTSNVSSQDLALYKDLDLNSAPGPANPRVSSFNSRSTHVPASQLSASNTRVSTNPTVSLQSSHKLSAGSSLQQTTGNDKQGFTSRSDVSTFGATSRPSVMEHAVLFREKAQPTTRSEALARKETSHQASTKISEAPLSSTSLSDRVMSNSIGSLTTDLFRSKPGISGSGKRDLDGTQQPTRRTFNTERVGQHPAQISKSFESSARDRVSRDGLVSSRTSLNKRSMVDPRKYESVAMATKSAPSLKAKTLQPGPYSNSASSSMNSANRSVPMQYPVSPALEQKVNPTIFSHRRETKGSLPLLPPDRRRTTYNYQSASGNQIMTRGPTNVVNRQTNMPRMQAHQSFNYSPAVNVRQQQTLHQNLSPHHDNGLSPARELSNNLGSDGHTVSHKHTKEPPEPREPPEPHEQPEHHEPPEPHELLEPNETLEISEPPDLYEEAGPDDRIEQVEHDELGHTDSGDIHNAAQHNDNEIEEPHLNDNLHEDATTHLDDEQIEDEVNQSDTLSARGSEDYDLNMHEETHDNLEHESDEDVPLGSNGETYDSTSERDSNDADANPEDHHQDDLDERDNGDALVEDQEDEHLNQNQEDSPFDNNEEDIDHDQLDEDDNLQTGFSDNELDNGSQNADGDGNGDEDQFDQDHNDSDDHEFDHDLEEENDEFDQDQLDDELYHNEDGLETEQVDEYGEQEDDNDEHDQEQSNDNEDQNEVEEIDDEEHDQTEDQEPELADDEDEDHEDYGNDPDDGNEDENEHEEPVDDDDDDNEIDNDNDNDDDHDQDDTQDHEDDNDNLNDDVDDSAGFDNDDGDLDGGGYVEGEVDEDVGGEGGLDDSYNAGNDDAGGDFQGGGYEDY